MANNFNEADRCLDLIDYRSLKAKAMASLLIKEIDEELNLLECNNDNYGILGDIYSRIFNCLYENGAGWTTDKEREKFGMEPRDSKGWTISERLKQRQDNINAMLNISTLIPDKGKFK